MIPTTAITRHDLGLTQAEFDLAMDREGFVGHRILPIVGRDKPTGEYAKIKLESLLQTQKTDRNADGSYSRSRADWAKDTYETTERGHEATLDDRTIRRYGDVIDAEFYEAERIADVVLRDYETQTADLLFNATTFASQRTTVSTPWSTRGSADPVANVDAARENIFNNCGYEPNALVVSRPTYRDLINCDKIIDRLKQQGFQDARPGTMTVAALAQSLDIEMVIVSGSAKNTANPAQDRSLSRVWDKTMALLAKVAVTDNPAEPCLGHTMAWTEESAINGDRLDVIVEEYREEGRRGSTLRSRTDFGHKLKYKECAWLLEGISA